MNEKINRITFYSLDEQLKTVDHGEVSLEGANLLIDEYKQAQHELQGSGEYVLSKSMFGFNSGEDTFIEISFVDKNICTVRFEHKEPKKKWWMIFPKYHNREIEISNTDRLKEVVSPFCKLGIDSFVEYFLKLPESL